MTLDQICNSVSSSAVSLLFKLRLSRLACVLAVILLG
jgi:hypothetical protein